MAGPAREKWRELLFCEAKSLLEAIESTMAGVRRSARTRKQAQSIYDEAKEAIDHKQ